MGAKDKRVDNYIANAADFAKPILTHIRSLVHRGCPEVQETIKWNFPHFMHRGILCSMAAFTHHCAFGFWKGKILLGNDQEAKTRAEEAMGHFGRITNLSDLPSDTAILALIAKAVRLNDTGTKVPAKPGSPTPRKQLVIPGPLQAALAKHRGARTVFEKFSYSHRKEYVEWITEAKREETRNRRIQTTIEWLSQGKPRNWKYLDC